MTHLHTDQNDALTFDGIVHFLRSIASGQNLSTEVLELLLEQFEGLRILFGDSIPKEDVLRIISHQIEITRTGKIREPVDIVEFTESPEYMNQGAYVRPKIMDHLVKLHDADSYFYEVVLGGGIGVGKNYFTDISLGFDLYKLSCLYSPQSFYELAPGSKIIFIHQSKTEKLAKEVVFEHFGNRLELSGYFPKFFMFDKKFRKVMKFPHLIEVMPISSADTSALGMNVFGAVIDEMNFMSKVKKSKKAERYGEEEYDQAEVLYQTILRRMESRFDRLGRLPGKVYLISSANYEGDFIDRKEKEAKSNPHIFVMHMAQWESFTNRDGTLMKKKYSGKFFFVRKPSENAAGGVYDEEPESHDKKDASNIIAVPVEHREAFDRNLIGALRDIAGVAVTRTSRFISKDYIKNSFSKYEIIYGKEQIFTEKIIELTVNSEVQDLVNINFLRRLSPHGPFAVHIDLAISGDCAGVAIGHAVGSKEINVRLVYNRDTGEFARDSKGSLPVFGLPGLLQVVPPRGGEIELHVLRELVGIVADYIPIYWLTMDRHQSASTLQYFRSRNVSTGIVSVDRSPEAYIETKFAIKEGRVLLARHEVLLEEMPSLDQDNTTGKIDHPEGGSKDLSDSVAGVVFSLSNKKASYRIVGPPKVLPINVPIPKKAKREDSRRPSSGRRPFYS
jgi:hypothetical protein